MHPFIRTLAHELVHKYWLRQNAIKILCQHLSATHIAYQYRIRVIKTFLPNHISHDKSKILCFYYYLNSVAVIDDQTNEIVNYQV